MSKQLLRILIYCNAQKCQQLPQSFNSYSSAIAQIKKAEFELKQSCNTTRSSWIKKAEYYSCYNKSGYLLIHTVPTTYIYAKALISIWQQFKKADSFGKYYTAYIKGKFKLELH